MRYATKLVAIGAIALGSAAIAGCESDNQEPTGNTTGAPSTGTMRGGSGGATGSTGGTNSVGSTAGSGSMIGGTGASGSESGGTGAMGAQGPSR